MLRAEVKPQALRFIRCTRLQPVLCCCSLPSLQLGLGGAGWLVQRRPRSDADPAVESLILSLSI